MSRLTRLFEGFRYDPLVYLQNWDTFGSHPLSPPREPFAGAESGRIHVPSSVSGESYSTYSCRGTGVSSYYLRLVFREI